MKSRYVRVYCTHVIASSVVVAAVANCGGGERPPPESNIPVTTGQDAGAEKPVTMSGLENGQLFFGDNGLVNCGAQAAEKIITISNPTSDIVKFKAKVTSGQQFYKIVPEEGGIPARGTTGIQITPNPLPQESDITPELYSGKLEITLVPGDLVPISIPLHQTARGAIVTTTINNGDVDFGEVRVGKTGTQTFSLTNSGNLEVTANLALGTQVFRIDAAGSATAKLAPGATISKTLTLAPTNATPYTDALALTYNTSAIHCKQPPGSSNLKGKGTTSVSVAPGTLNFGLVDCNGPASSYQLVTIESTQAMNFTPVLEKGEQGVSPFTLVSDANGSPITPGVPIAMGVDSTYVIRVVPKAITAPAFTTDNAYGDVLRITSDLAGDQPHLVTLKQTARGAVLSLTPATIELTTQNTELGKTFPKTFQIVNSGNLAAPYTVSVEERAPAPDGTFSLNNGSGSVLPGTPALLTINMKAADALNTQYIGDIELLAPGAVLCGDLPPKMYVSIRTPAQ